MGNRVWIGLLAFSLVVFVALDFLFIYMVCIREITGLRIVGGILWFGFLTRTVWLALRRRLSISGADKFFS